jgi:hypothetical protein
MSLGPLVPRGDVRQRNDGSRELLPGEPAEFLRPAGPAFYNALPVQESTLREYMRVLIKRKWMVIAVVAGIFIVVAIASLRQTPVYQAVGRIAVNRADPNLITFKDSGPVVDYYDPADLDTEVRILQSDLMALQVIRQLNLDKRPEFGGHSDQKPPTWSPIPCRPIRIAPPPCWEAFAGTSTSLSFPTPASSRFNTAAPIRNSPPVP